MSTRMTLIALAMLLTACGGGGGGSDTDTASGAQGLWVGTTSTNRAATGLVFSDGTYYVLYSAVGQPNIIAGAVQGSSTASGGSWSSSNARDFNLEGLGVSSGTLSGSYTARQSVSGTVTYSGGTTGSFSGTYNTDYEITPTLTALTGTYTAQVAFSQGVQSGLVTIDSAGNISASAQGCSSTGTATPRTDGNAYNVRVTFGGSPCFFAGQTFNGVAYYDAANRTIYAAAPNAARTDGMIVVATKP